MEADLSPLDLDPSPYIPPPILPCLATPGPFRAWLTGLVPTREVGRRRSSTGCPLAWFLQAEGFPDPRVDDGFVTTEPDGEWIVYAVPAWASQFVREIDAGAAGRPLPVTAHEALTILAQGESA